MNSIFHWSELFIGLRKITMMIYAERIQLVLLIVIPAFIINLSACISTRVISKSEITDFDRGEYYYVVHSSRQEFQLEKSASISNGILSGRIFRISSDNYTYNGDKIHLYLSSDTVIRIEKGEFLSVPINAVTKAEFENFTTAGKAGIIFIFLGIIIGISVLGIVTSGLGYSPNW